MKTAVLMSRVSSDEQAQGYSLGVQEEALTRYCEKNNIGIIQKFREDHSAKDFNRPEFAKFMLYARKHKGQIDYLFVTSWDRFSRNITDAFLMIRTLKNLGITVQAIEQQADLSIPENKAMLALFLAIPEIDNERRSIKIKGGMRAALKAGRWCRKAPLGYRNSRDENNKPIIVPGSDAAFIKKMFKSIAGGKSQAEIRAELKEQGFKVGKSNISTILRNAVYMGKIKVPASTEEPEQTIEGVHKGIITEQLFYQVQTILEDNLVARKRPKYITQRKELFLRGNLVCSKCGSKLTGSPSRSRNGTRYYYYHCNHCRKERYRAEKANRVMDEVMSAFKFTSEADELYRVMLKSLLSSSNVDMRKEIGRLEKERERFEDKVRKVQDLYVDGDLTKEDYLIMRERYSTEKSKVEQRLSEIRSINGGLKSSLEKGVGILSNIGRIYSNADLTGKRRIIGSIFPENLVFDGEKCRTTRLNEVLRHILLIDKEKQKNKSGQISNFMDLSAVVVPPGIEPGTHGFSVRCSTD
jgi:site-specific DNA recombinase